MAYFKRFFTYIPLLLFWSGVQTLAAQGDPGGGDPGDPGALSVYQVQDMQFGVFSHGVSGGTVVLSTAGMRSVTGDVLDFEMGVSYFQAIFEVAAPIGAIISIMNGADATLTGSNGGSMMLELGDSSPETPYLNSTPSPARTAFHIGGTLTVGSVAANPPGNYSGTFYITFNIE